MKHAIGIDLGGTRIKLALIDEKGTVVSRRELETGDMRTSCGEEPELCRRWIAGILAASGEMEEAAKIRADCVGLAAPGIPARDGRSIAHMPGRLNGLETLVWADALGLGIDVPVLNDAQAALFAEAWIGAAAGAANAAMLNLGTGVGGALLVGGSILRGSTGRAGHLGHMSLDVDGPPDICGTPGSLEGMVGDCSVELRSNGRYRNNLELAKARESGDPFARELWLESMKALACGIVSIVNAFDPETVVIGGGLTNCWDEIYPTLSGFLDSWEWRPDGQGVPVRRAELGPLSGAIGAARNALVLSS
jgi:glucokinase